MLYPYYDILILTNNKLKLNTYKLKKKEESLEDKRIHTFENVTWPEVVELDGFYLD